MERRSRSSHRWLSTGVDDLAWREALGRCGGPDNGDRLWPVLATGLSDLLQREGAQQVALQEHQQRLELLARAARDLARKQQTMLRDRLEGVKRREVRLGLSSQGLWDRSVARVPGHAFTTQVLDFLVKVWDLNDSELSMVRKMLISESLGSMCEVWAT